jgi:hypothetical protein
LNQIKKQSAKKRKFDAKEVEPMGSRQLPQDVISLVHHVHLNQNGWWKKGVSQVVSGLLWTESRPLAVNSVRELLRSEYDTNMSADAVQTCFDAMILAGDLVELGDGRYKLSEKAALELSVQAHKGQEEYNRARDYFIKEVQLRSTMSLEGERVWDSFVTELTDAVQKTGANTYSLLIGESIKQREDWLASFVTQYGEENVECLKDVLASFFSDANPDGKQYVLKLMTAYFFVEATQLSKNTIDSIDAKRNQRSLRVYLDTNFLFSVLGLHDNPADDAALSLLELAKSAHNYVDIKFLVCPHTIDEAQHTLANCLSQAKTIRATRALQGAVSSVTMPSALRKYFNAAAQATNPLSAEDFFNPYITGLKVVLKQRRIEVDETIDVSKYRIDQRVVDDVLELNGFEEKREGGRKKSYEAIEHDVILWHAVNDKRPKHTSSPFDAGSWVVTADHRVIVFDRRKARGTHVVPTAMFPSSLVQLIQFWVPRSSELEATLLDSLKLPLFFREFDRDDEQVTVKILGALSRYRDVDDLGVETVREILVSDALRQRIANLDSSSEEEVAAILKDEIVQRNKQLNEKLEAAGKSTDALQEAYKAEETSRKSAEQRAESEMEARIESDRVAREAQEALAQQTKANLENKTKVESLQEQLDSFKIAESKKSFITYFGVVGPLLIIGSFLAFAKFGQNPPMESVRLYWPNLGYLLVGLTSITLLTFAARRYLRSHPELDSWRVAQKFGSIRIQIIAFLGTGVLPGFFGDAIKKFLGIG